MRRIINYHDQFRIRERAVFLFFLVSYPGLSPLTNSQTGSQLIYDPAPGRAEAKSGTQLYNRGAS